MKKLDFIIIGAGKAGTTWLWQLLREHPGCYLPAQKELHYFNSEPLEPIGRDNPNYRKSLDWYHAHFNNAPADLQWGEVSPGYLWSCTAPQRIREYNPDVKIVAILRDPLERALSHYLYRLQKGLIADVGFAAAVEKDPFMLERSLYGKCLSRYFDIFPRENIGIFFFEELKNAPLELSKKLQAFLGLDGLDIDCLRTVNETGHPRYPRINRLVAKADLFARKSNIKSHLQALLKFTGAGILVRNLRGSVVPFGEKPGLEPAIEKKLREFFCADICLLEKLIGQDLSHWEKN